MSCTSMRTTEVEMAFAQRNQIKTVRELWNLREQARVRDIERGFLQELQDVLTHTVDTLLGDTDMHIEEVQEDRYDYPLYFGPELERYREGRNRTMDEVRALQQRHHVRRLNRFFTEPHPETPRMIRSSSWGSDLAEARTVSNALDSEFRHHLEQVVVTRRNEPNARNRRRRTEELAAEEGMYAQGTIQEEIERLEREEERENNWMAAPGNGVAEINSRRLIATIRNLEEEVTQLKNVVSAGFDIQLDIQRAIRQEVAAAIHGGWKANSSATTTNGFESMKSAPRKSGRCTVCLEAPIDSLLYSCGHMCTCSGCGRGLLAANQKCPICRAPVRDVVRCFVVTADTPLSN